jgi:hypothetical protein
MNHSEQSELHHVNQQTVQEENTQTEQSLELEEEQLEAVAGGTGCLDCFKATKVRPLQDPRPQGFLTRTPSGHDIFRFTNFPDRGAYAARNTKPQPEQWQVVEGNLRRLPGGNDGFNQRVHILRPAGTRSSIED